MSKHRQRQRPHKSLPRQQPSRYIGAPCGKDRGGSGQKFTDVSVLDHIKDCQDCQAILALSDDLASPPIP